MNSEDSIEPENGEEIQEIDELEDEFLQKVNKKSTLKIVTTVIAISLFFGGFNLTILLDTVFLGKYLCSPAVFSCSPNLKGDTAAATATFVYSALKTISVVAFMFALIIGGAISDDLRTRFGNRVPMIMLGATIAGIGYIILPYIVVGNNPDYILVAGGLTYIFIYTGLGFALAPEYALISELFTKEERGWAGMGFAGIGLIGTIIGVVLQEIYVSPFGPEKLNAPELVQWNTIGLVAGMMIIVLGLLTFIMTPKINPPFPSDGVIQDIINTPKYLFQLGSGDANKDFLLMFIVGMFWGGGGFIISSYLPIFIDNLGNKTTIISTDVLLIMGVSGALFAGPVGVMIAKLGKVKSGMLGSLVLGFFTFMFAQSFSWGNNQIILLSILAGFGLIFITAVNISLPADLVPRGKEGQFMGLFIVAANLSVPVVGTVVTIILSSTTDSLLGLSTVFLMSTILYFGAVFILGFMHYESQLEGEYKLFYRRYLIAKGYVSDKAKFTAMKVTSSIRKSR